MEKAAFYGLVSVIVVNFNGRHIIGTCLDSLRRQAYPSVEVIVVDNGSTDGSVEWLAQSYPDVRIVSLDANLGFAAGTNAGIQVARGEFIATLNNDARGERTWIEEMVQAIRDRPEVGMVATKMLFADDAGTINSAGIAIDRAGFAWDRLGGSPDFDDESIEVFGPCAGAALYRRALFDDVGLFDDDFFMYLEDVDLAWRARLAGWHCRYAPRARALHDYSATAIDTSPFKGFLLGRNKVWLIAKNYPMPDLLLYLPVIVWYDIATVLYSLILRHGNIPYQSRLARARGRLSGLSRLGVALAKRGAVQAKRRIPRWRVSADLADVAWPWSLQARYAHLSRRNSVRSPGLTSK